jgi:hypothetical protein
MADAANRNGLTYCEGNPRIDSDAQIAQIAASIAEFGFNNPILVDTKAGILAGHVRLLAARKQGLKEVPVIVLDHLTEAQKRAYIIADDQLALNAGWDEGLLRLELAALQLEDFDLSQQVNKILDEYAAQGFVLTLRQLYYQFVARGLAPNTQKEYKNLGSLVNDARLARSIDWNHLEDRARNLESNSHWRHPSSIVETSAEQFMYVKWRARKRESKYGSRRRRLPGSLMVSAPNSTFRTSAAGDTHHNPRCGPLHSVCSATQLRNNRWLFSTSEITIPAVLT